MRGGNLVLLKCKCGFACYHLIDVIIEYNMSPILLTAFAALLTSSDDKVDHLTKSEKQMENSF